MVSVFFKYLRMVNDFVNQTKDLDMKVLFFSLIAGMFILIAGFRVNQEPKPWPVPDAASKKANPVKTSKESVSAGKSLYNQHCASCHGKTGLGDGSKAAQLKTHPGDFSTAADFFVLEFVAEFVCHDAGAGNRYSGSQRYGSA